MAKEEVSSLWISYWRARLTAPARDVGRPAGVEARWRFSRQGPTCLPAASALTSARLVSRAHGGVANLVRRAKNRPVEPTGNLRSQSGGSRRDRSGRAAFSRSRRPEKPVGACCGQTAAARSGNCSEVSPSTRTSPWYRASKSTLMTSALVSSIHMTQSVWAVIKRSLSPACEFRGNSYRRVGLSCWRAGKGIFAMLE